MGAYTKGCIVNDCVINIYYDTSDGLTITVYERKNKNEHQFNNPRKFFSFMKENYNTEKIDEDKFEGDLFMQTGLFMCDWIK